MDFSKTLIRSSAFGALMTEPQLKAEKEAGELSKTAKTYLLSVYIKAKYGRERDLDNKYIRKGNMVEEDNVGMLSQYLNRPLIKNEDRICNNFISGTPDLWEGESIMKADHVIDIKSSFDIFTFFSNLPNKLDATYYWQVMGYMWLTGAKSAAVAYCLFNTPEEIISQEKYYMLRKMTDAATEENPEYIKAAAKIDFDSTYDDIPFQERILIFPVERNEDDILRMQSKVIQARAYLAEIEKKHLHFNDIQK
jgi:hypothetical protein